MGYGSDVSFGGPGPDYLWLQGLAPDRAFGGEGADLLGIVSGTKGDKLYGGPGTDSIGTTNTDLRPITSVSAYFGGRGIDYLGLWHGFKPITIDLTSWPRHDRRGDSAGTGV